MKKNLLLALLAVVVFSPIAHAQKYKSPQWNGCIQQFYDRDTYNWLAFRNNCSEALKVVFIANNPGYGGSSMNLRPGTKGSTGFSRSEVGAKDGFELYVCPMGYNPVDGEDNYVERTNTRFRCKEQ